MQNIGIFLQLFHSCGPADWPKHLRSLEQALATWIQSKTKFLIGYSSIRDQGTVLLLQRQVKTARTLPRPTAWSPTYPHIEIAQDPFCGDFVVPDDFYTTVSADLNQLISKANGRQLLKDLSDACTRKNKEVVIQYNAGLGGTQCAPVNVAITSDFRRDLSEKQLIKELMTNPGLKATGFSINEGRKTFTEGGGANAVIKFNPADPGPKGDCHGDDARDSFIALAHELVHAYHFVCGTCRRQPTGSTNGDFGLAEEEMRTIGCKGYDGEIPSENWIRAEWNLPMRYKYSGYDFADTKVG